MILGDGGGVLAVWCWVDFGESAIEFRQGRAAESVEGGVTFGGNGGAHLGGDETRSSGRQFHTFKSKK